ncbi:phenylacetate--CoA ligase PaaK [Priestia filamentosa]|uniref:Phenylacetate-coenzyme A ligase n=1 Tax=Priestia filamentosa TaxID=1402861 RepID=A0A1X7E8T5_9BACI|nr:phenylacetate--CoA ligase PaaK [Priestia filamentosa]AKO92596.1 phenylacetate-CoA ligase [Priestia filamentosa]MDT3762675.1 phenylacetate--CoA ligase PaaK [Priestia filamentosa]OXS69210.1 phenylacetate-CoA ligase [Priestia filamentosa]RJS64078.1 phenylacetate--CoA ligase [Priestia filamentosa]WRU97136.1 phenylacetate--CoA ligase PaaK [Priestia filamentosa]
MIIHDVEMYSRKEMKALQLSRLKETLIKVYDKVPFYQEKFRELAISPEDIQTLEDINKLPFTKKSDLRENYPFNLFAVDMKELVRLHASSGTSGKPTVVGYTKNDISNWSDIVARAIAIAGGEPAGIFHNAYGYGLFTGGLGLHYGGERLGMATVPISGGNTDRQISLIKDFKPTVIAGTPSYILKIAEEMETRGLNPRESSIKFGIFGAEPWSEEMRKVLEEKFDLKACDIYGLSEVMGPGVAVECHEAQNGLHIAEDHFFVEVINPDTLEQVPDGEEGELVFTSLTKEAFPVIRYRTGDIASITRETCRCGRTTTRMSRVKGRIDDMLIIRGVNVFPSEIEHYLIQIQELAPHYQVHLACDGTLDIVELHVEINEEIYQRVNGNMAHEHIQSVVKKVQHSMKNNCLVSMNIKALAPKSIPRSEGKAIRILDKRKSLFTI